MDDAISRKGTSAWLENMGYSYPAKVIMDEKRFPSVLGTNLAEVGTDLISRQAAIDAMAELQGRASAKGILIGIHRAWEAIKALPPAEPERIKGHWIEHDDGLTACECSVCHEKYNLYEEDVFGRSFCPNCGAKMEARNE